MISIDEIIFIFSHRLMIFSSTFIHFNQNINFLFIIFVVMKICLFMFHCVNFDSINNRNHWWICVDNKNEYQFFHSHCQRFVDIFNLFFEEWTKNQIESVWFILLALKFYLQSNDIILIYCLVDLEWVTLLHNQTNLRTSAIVLFVLQNTWWCCF